MEYKDYYKVLGVEKTASADQIKKAYKKLAIKFHPDKNPGDKAAEAKFKEINEANQILGSADKRKKYDEMGENWDQFGGPNARQNPYYQQRGPSGAGGFDASGFGAEGNFSDFFESFFGGSGSQFGTQFSAGRGRSRSSKGSNLEAKIDISLEEAYQGSDYRVSLDGKPISIKLKPGLSEGQKLRLKGKGSPGTGGADSGDLIIEVHIIPDKRYERKGDDLYFDVHIPLYTAVLGGKADVVTLEKTVRIDVAPGTENNKLVRLKGLGMPVYGKANQKGDAYARIIVDIPKQLTDKERELFTSLASLHK